MTSKIENEIYELLKQGDTTLVADDLLKRWVHGELSSEDQITAGLFLLNSGFFSTLQNHLLHLLTQDKEISWIPLLELIHRFDKNLPESLLEQILIGMTEQNALEDLIRVKSFAISYARLKPVYEKLLAEKVKQLQNVKTDLVDKLQRAVNDRLDEEIQKISRELQEKFPRDEQIQDLASDLDLARIRSLLQKKEREFAENLDFVKVDKKTAQELERETKKISEAALKACAKFPDLAYDIAIALAHIEAFEEALKCLNFSPASTAKDWLRLDLLLKSKNYLSVLAESFEIEKKYAQKPETLFSVLILRAQALFGLGEKQKAISILEKIVEAQPKNQSAKVLLQGWRTSL